MPLLCVQFRKCENVPKKRAIDATNAISEAWGQVFHHDKFVTMKDLTPHMT